MSRWGLRNLVNRRLVVWGAGLDGAATIALLSSRNDICLVVDDPATNGPAQELAASYALPLSGPSSAVLGGADLIVRAPGVSRYRAELAGLLSSNLAALWMADDHAGTIIGVTGTKGKSTTSHLAALLLRADGHVANLGGNIGVPVLELDEAAPFHVVEISSYMAADMQRSPDIGVLTNLGEDHLTWHGSVERYHADKLNLFAHDRQRLLIVSGADEPAVSATAGFPNRVLSGTAGWIVDESSVSHAGHELTVDLSGTPLARNHFALDLCAALTAVEGASGSVPSTAAIESVVANYTTLPSRLEPVATVDGVEYIDDALASNPFGACAALAAYPDFPVVILLGGQDRGVDLAPLIAAIQERRAPISIVLFSQTRDRMAATFKDAGVAFERYEGDDLDGPVRLAHQLAIPGTVVLFSPAVPTPASMGNYADRSRAFKAAVASLAQG
jgi:UDP-N-acetylmuramoyl-L-alanine---L-glutamate ligase